MTLDEKRAAAQTVKEILWDKIKEMTPEPPGATCPCRGHHAGPSTVVCIVIPDLDNLDWSMWSVTVTETCGHVWDYDLASFITFTELDRIFKEHFGSELYTA